MEKFTTLDAVAIPYFHHNVDTNQLCPTRFNKVVRGPAFAKILFHDHRFDTDGSPQEFIFNREPYASGRVIVAGRNFGCGSSRESAVYALYEFGIRAVIAGGFGSIFQANCMKNGIVPVALPDEVCESLADRLEREPGAHVVVDLEAQQVRFRDDCWRFNIHPLRKKMLLSGMDDIRLTLDYGTEIDAFEKRYREKFHWIASDIQM